MLGHQEIYMSDFHPKVVEYGKKAVHAFESLQDIQSVVVHCDYTGQSSLELSIGRSSTGPFVFSKDSKRDHAFFQDTNEEELFRVAVRFIDYHQSFVNSDPGSPDYFQPTMDAIELEAEIKKAFEIETV